jgi:sulfate adenylyltransferase large subunit
MFSMSHSNLSEDRPKEKATMEEIALPIVITGHIDHGKSTLIGRLLYDTGVLKEDRYREITQTSSLLGKTTEFAFALDALEEERERGITIDTTQIYFQTPKRKYVIIDAPGHKEFLRNMITGASYAEAAVLIIDAKEGIMEQTKRHAYLLNMVGIKEVCVLINKMDLVGFSKAVFDQIRKDILPFFSLLSIKPRAFIPISALSGLNVAHRDTVMDWYRGPSFLETLDELEFKAFEKRPFRFPVQDLFQTGDEMVILGRIESGEVEKGREVFILPEGTQTRIKEIKKFMQTDIQKASCGESIGLTLDRMDSVRRGTVLSGSHDTRITNTFEANVIWFEGSYDENEKIKLRCTTQESDCRMTIHEKFDPATMDKKLDRMNHLEIGEVAKVKIQTERKMVIDFFSYIPELGRFIIEKNGIPVGGGIVV